MTKKAAIRRGEIQHSSHKQHALIFVHLPSEYRCDGCQESGYGFRYRCGPCDFDIHESCAQAPNATLHSCHPQHPLVLRDKPVSPQRVCDVCGRDVLGFVYDCRECDVDVHLSCAQLPQTLRHALHPHHTLQLSHGPEAPAPPARSCNVCGEACSPGHWSYRCELASAPCDFNLHIPCAKLVVDPFEEMRMQSISPLEVPRHNSAAAVDSSAAPSSTGVAAQVESVMQSGLEAQVELMKIQNKMMVASAVFDVQRACALSLYRRY